MKLRRDANGVHAFDRQTGLNVLLDEVPVPPEHWDTAPRFLSIALTNACDLHCGFCYAPKHAARLAEDQVVDWAIELDRNGCLGIGFGGGEPTLHPQFSRICQRVAESTDLAVSFTTHGHHINDALLDELAGVVHFIRLSMDGVGATYTRIRGREFAVFLDKVRLVSRAVPFGINYVVNATTFGSLDLAAEVAFEHGALELLLLPERAVAGSGGIDDSTRSALAQWIEDHPQYRLAISALESMEGALPIAGPFNDPDGLTAYAHIDASGWIRRSSFSPDGVLIESSPGAALSELRSCGF